MLLRAISAALAAAHLARVSAQPYPFTNTSLPAAQRAADLLSRLTLHEKIGMLFMDANMAYGNDSLPKGGDLPSTAVPRLGVPQFNWFSQGSAYRGAANGCILGCCSSCPPASNIVGEPGACCHDGFATQLPQGTGVAATWNAYLIFRAGVVVSDESRGMQNGFPGGAVIADYRTGASSVINILRDPRWGRAPETYGECPALTGAIAVALNKGLMGYAALNASVREFGEYVKVLPSVRHFVAYAGPDSSRFSFNAIVSEDDLRLTYLPAWRALVEADALGGVMSAISALNSIPSAAHASLLTGVLRGEWGFPGFVLSDCDTISAVADSFHYVSSVEQAAVAALRAGGDLNCGPEYALLYNATALHGLLSEARDIDPAVLRLLTARVQVGDLDLPGAPTPYLDIPYSVVDSPPHRALARQVVRESVVLLRNDGGALPLLPGSMKTLLVVGPSADDDAVQAHTYHGTPSAWTTILQGLRASLNGTATPMHSSGGDSDTTGSGAVNVTYVKGCSRTGGDKSGFAAALAAVASADAVLYVGGLEASMEEEDTDRGSLALPGVQLELIQALFNATLAAAPEKTIPMAAVIISGGPVSEPWMAGPSAAGLAWVWVSYFGQDGGGVADVLLGAYSPSGRLPFTMPVDVSQLGPITDYSMRGPPFGRTYRYLDYSKLAALPLFPFAHGLSYSDVAQSAVLLPRPVVAIYDQAVPVIVTVTNHGPIAAADTVVAVFGEFLTCAGKPSPVVAAPLRTLLAFTKLMTTLATPINATLFVNLTAVPGADRQPLPGLLRVWSGDGGQCAACPTATLQLSLGAVTCAAAGHAEL